MVSSAQAVILSSPEVGSPAFSQAFIIFQSHGVLIALPQKVGFLRGIEYCYEDHMASITISSYTKLTLILHGLS